MTYLSNPNRLADADDNAEGVYNLQPRVARVSALPWVIGQKGFATLNGLPNRVVTSFFANSFRVRPVLIDFVKYVIAFARALRYLNHHETRKGAARAQALC
jgi:hypothetical protein